MVPNNPTQVDEDSIQTETFNLRIGRFKLCLVKYQGEIFIPKHEELPVTSVSTSWLEDLNRTRQTRCRPWQDWLMEWELLLQQRSYQRSFLTQTSSCQWSRTLSYRLTMWSVICTVSDNKVIYSLVQGEAPEAEFTGSRRQCLAYIRRMSAE
jgi:hypothetical protein